MDDRWFGNEVSKVSNAFIQIIAWQPQTIHNTPKLDILYIYENKNENENVIHRQIQNLEVNLG